MKNLAPVDDSEDVIALIEVSATPRYVDHGSDANFVRPAGSRPVIWRGTVKPVNMVNGDKWEDANLGGSPDPFLLMGA